MGLNRHLGSPAVANLMGFFCSLRTELDTYHKPLFPEFAFFFGEH